MTDAPEMRTLTRVTRMGRPLLGGAAMAMTLVATLSACGDEQGGTSPSSESQATVQTRSPQPQPEPEPDKVSAIPDGSFDVCSLFDVPALLEKPQLDYAQKRLDETPFLTAVGNCFISLGGPDTSGMVQLWKFKDEGIARERFDMDKEASSQGAEIVNLGDEAYSRGNVVSGAGSGTCHVLRGPITLMVELSSVSANGGSAPLPGSELKRITRDICDQVLAQID